MWGIGLFVSLRLNIFLYYFITVTLFISFLYYFLLILKIDNFYLLATFFMSFIALSGFFISRLAVDPLEEYATNLQDLSKETLHELNLPISTIKTNTQMLQKSLNDEKSEKRVLRIDAACLMLEERYNELDYLIKMQSNTQVKEEFELSQFMQERVEFLSRLYPHITFNVSSENCNVFSDKKGLCKVIDNIVDNGVKYSPDSKTIDIKISNKILCIRDYGIGMDEVELLKIFDKYYQSNKNMQGFGIGLSMVKRFCDKNRITLSFHSKPKHGTKVELKFN